LLLKSDKKNCAGDFRLSAIDEKGGAKCPLMNSTVKNVKKRLALLFLFPTMKRRNTIARSVKAKK
jgi:hypothetical protein